MLRGTALALVALAMMVPVAPLGLGAGGVRC